MASKTKENYLKAIYGLSLQSPDVSASELSRELGVSVPTVNSMVKKLELDKLITYTKYRPLRMTAKGRRLAADIVRKHRLTEMFLVQIMGFGWEEVHHIAEEMEHIDSDRLFDRMDDLLNYPSVDPHGSPIPDKQGIITQVKYQRLSDARVGDDLRLCALSDSSAELMRYLNDVEISLGQQMRLLKLQPFDKSAHVQVKVGETLVLSAAVCDCLMMEVV